MAIRINYTKGDKIGNLIFLEDRESIFSPCGTSQRAALFQCTCNKEFECRIQSVKTGLTTSCGCLTEVVFIRSNKKRIKHGKAGSTEYHSWSGMMARCYNPKHSRYKNYAPKNITVCDRWLESFENFYEDMGPKPSPKHSLDRINNDSNYEPSNCRWVTPKEQNRNKNNNVSISYKSETKCMTDWAEQLNIPIESFYARLKRGWSIEKTIETPLRSCKKKSS